jgi:hypothetical protein
MGVGVIYRLEEPMSTLQAILFGVMLALTPSLIVLAALLHGAPDMDFD